MDSDYGQASLEVGGAYLTTVALDCLLALVSAFEKLTDIAVDGAPLTPKQQGMSSCSSHQDLTWSTEELDLAGREAFWSASFLHVHSAATSHLMSCAQPGCSINVQVYGFLLP